ncbi:uncharacterized protein ATNIH1004_002090 [Aspergillus tanneri]|uniref:Uncharacterized protein n=1 Tax=Aspergillus tanneri TaxID=1220188 RepID=A0A5M9MXQ1_9EURO|nr:uncharacterized protein ATNIH1004_002090 [Aspergillus tanneri]KAA8649419.1 hypothetical protein ATNIH1004_002090 [Aspergillus tanneri]
MAQRPNNTDLPPKETTQPLKGKGPHQQNDPGDWESQEREPWANAMECVQGQAQMYCYPRVVFEVFEPHVYTPLPAQPPSPAQQGDETGEVQQTQRWHQDYPPWAKGKPFVSTWTGAGVVCTWTTEAADGDKGGDETFAQISNITLHKRPDLPDTSGEGDSTPSGSAEAGEDGNPSHSGETERGAGVKTTSSSEDERGRTHGEGDGVVGGFSRWRRRSFAATICENTHISKLKTCEKALEEPLPLLAEAEECARTARSLVV